MLENDIQLVESTLKGDIRGFEKLVERYQMLAMKYIYNIVKDSTTTEDICQEVFITVYNKLDTYNKKYKFSNWLIQIAKNKAIDYVRKRNKVKTLNIEDAYNVSSNEISPEENAELKETKSTINNYLKTLNEQDKQILLLKYSTERTFKDISLILKIPESTVKRRFYKVRQEFKKYILGLEKRCEYEL
ncbi:RNA polymerase sigma factor [Clostridium sediminicola]|uniref:RNA polymerase sigma factor n=1 Tax=Clostridium sediminicola TaxID=3114879 RepID=UPI0031F20DA0